MKTALILGIIPAQIRWKCPNNCLKRKRRPDVLTMVHPGGEMVGVCPACGKSFNLVW